MTSQMNTAPWSNWNEADAKIKKISDKIKNDAQGKIPVNFGTYIPLVYRTQKAVGTNYELKMYVGQNQCIALIVWESDDPSEPLRLTNSALAPLPGV